MKTELMAFLQCVFCGSEELHLNAPGADGLVVEGAITCPNCNAIYPIVDGIPRMMRQSAAEHGPILEKIGLHVPDVFNENGSAGLKKTRSGFNEQFNLSRRASGIDLAHAIKVRDQSNFFAATETNAETANGFFDGKVFLDVGLGGGQYSYDALGFGSTVISLDINDVGLTEYNQSFRNHPRQHVIQASALDIPIHTESVDYAWAMGVLHHTEDLLRGFHEMARVLSIGGYLNVGVYYRYTLWRYYRLMRKLTTRLPYGALWALSHALATISYIPGAGHLCHPWVERTEPYQSRVTGAFDHFHPPYQGYYTVDEVASWYEELECFSDIHMTHPFNNFIGQKTAPLKKYFSETTKRSIMRC